MPVVIRATSGIALYGMQHNNSLETWFAHMPGLLVAMPSSPADVKGMIKTALRGDDPVVFLMHKRLGGRRGEVGDEETLVPFGRANLVRSGHDVTIVAYSEMVARALEAAKLLAEEGIEVEVIDLRTLMPLDLETIETSVQRTRRLVIVGESPRFLGIGSEIAAAIQETLFRELAAPIQRVGAPHVPIPASPPLYQAMSPQVADIARAVRKAMTS
jgi:pyruvate dehydrogenase E1 component beta subunit